MKWEEKKSVLTISEFWDSPARFFAFFCTFFSKHKKNLVLSKKFLCYSVIDKKREKDKVFTILFLFHVSFKFPYSLGLFNTTIFEFCLILFLTFLKMKKGRKIFFDDIIFGKDIFSLFKKIFFFCENEKNEK